MCLPERSGHGRAIFESFKPAAKSRARKIAVVRGRPRKLLNIVGGQSDGTREVGPGAIGRGIGRSLLRNDDCREQTKKKCPEEF